MHANRTVIQFFVFKSRLKFFQANSYILNSLKEYPSTLFKLSHHHTNLHSSAILYARNIEDNDQESVRQKDGAKNVSQCWVDYLKCLSFKERCVRKISKCLQCSEHEANFLIDADELTFLDKIDFTIEKIEFLLERGITVNSIRTNTYVLCHSFGEFVCLS